MKDNAFFRFAQLMRSARQMPGMPEIDPMEERVLNGLAEAWRAGGTLTVLRAMNLDFGISPTTAHRRLKALHAKGLIDFVVQTGDARSKAIVPTALALRYFSKLSSCIARAAEEATA